MENKSQLSIVFLNCKKFENELLFLMLLIECFW